MPTTRRIQCSTHLKMLMSFDCQKKIITEIEKNNKNHCTN